MTIAINEKINAYYLFFSEISGIYGKVYEVFKHQIEKYAQLKETYGALIEDDEEENPHAASTAQLSQLRMLEREFQDCFQKVDTAMLALMDDMDKRIEFHEIMLEGMGVR